VIQDEAALFVAFTHEFGPSSIGLYGERVDPAPIWDAGNRKARDHRIG
jgi:hypothetical protein